MAIENIIRQNFRFKVVDKNTARGFLGFYTNYFLTLECERTKEKQSVLMDSPETYFSLSIGKTYTWGMHSEDNHTWYFD